MVWPIKWRGTPHPWDENGRTVPQPSQTARGWQRGLGIRAEGLNRLVVTFIRLEDRR